MAEISPKIQFYDAEKIKNINPETMKLWKKYEIDMTLRELSPKTKSGYLNDLQHWWIYIYDNQGNQCITDLSEDDITEFLYYCRTQGNNSRRMKRRMSSIAAFYKFLRKKKLIDNNPTEFIDRPKKDTEIITQTFLTMDQVNQIYEELDKNISESKTMSGIHSALQLKCYAMFSLSTMARVTAISSVKWNQIDFDQRVANNVLEKEGYLVTLSFSEDVKSILIELKEFRKNNNINDEGFLFVTQMDGVHRQVTTSTLNQWCKKIGAMIGVPTLHPHDFRHSGSQLMKLNGAKVEDISAMLNHKSTDVTIKYYLRVDQKKIQESHDKFGI
ncbi:MAG: tyrosine-type recombinase/integrase [Bacilli bacterium]